MKRPIQSKDVVRIIAGPCKGNTGVVNRLDEERELVNIFQRGAYIGIWFRSRDVKRIGRVRGES